MYVDDSTHIPGLPSVLFSITYNMQNWRRKGWECLSHEWHQGLPIGKQTEVGISMVQTILGSVVSVQMLESWIVLGISGHGVNSKLRIVNTVFPQSFCFCGTTIWGQRLFRWKAWRHQLLLDKVRYVQAIQWRLLNAVSSKWSLSVLLKQVVQQKQPWNRNLGTPSTPLLSSLSKSGISSHWVRSKFCIISTALIRHHSYQASYHFLFIATHY